MTYGSLNLGLQSTLGKLVHCARDLTCYVVKNMADDILERLTLELPIDNGKILQNDTVFKGGSMQVVHSVIP